MPLRPLTVLVLCTGNSARSILGEALLNEMGNGRVLAYSAGSRPRGVPHPEALRLLARRGHVADAFRSKSWDEFTGPEAPPIDLAITVCGNAAGEACPVFPGAPLRTHWGLPDPAEAGEEGPQVEAAFALTCHLLEKRIAAFLALPFETMDKPVLLAELVRIGSMEGSA